MNRNLLVFALLMIILGASFGFYPLSLVGVLVLFGALFSSPRQPQRPVPVPSRQETRRMPLIQPMRMQARTAPAQRMPVETTGPPPPPQSLTYSPALFPTLMFPSLSQMGGPPQPSEQTPPPTAERDEVVEMGAVLALLKLAFG